MSLQNSNNIYSPKCTKPNILLDNLQPDENIIHINKYRFMDFYYEELDKLNNLDYSNNQIKEESSIPSKFPLIKKEDNNNNNNNLFKKERKVENNKYAKNILKDNFLYILLQPSPVDTKFRLSRLTNIDNGWAQWTDNLSQLYQVVQIYASTTDNEINKNKLHNINVITLDKNSSSASDYLVQAFSHLVLKEKPPRWLVFANDHTFIVPPNLVCFLKSLDSELPIYTGFYIIKYIIYIY